MLRTDVKSEEEKLSRPGALYTRKVERKHVPTGRSLTRRDEKQLYSGRVTY